MGQYFADIHASPASQLGSEPCCLEDTPEVTALRGAESFQELMELAKALCFSLRYREAIEIYNRAIALEPMNINGYRQRAARYISTLQPGKAVDDLLHCRELGGDEEDVSYRLGIAHYLAGDYVAAMAEEAACFPLCDDEMGIAAMFWHTLSAWRAGAEPVLLNSFYHTGMAVGHHTAYEMSMALAAGVTELEAANARLSQIEEDLEFSIFAYGVYSYMNFCGLSKRAKKLLDNIILRDSFWISYAYIASWNDCFTFSL